MPGAGSLNGPRPAPVNRERSVDYYLSSVPTEQRPLLDELRALIWRNLETAEESFECGFPVYKIGGEWAAGVASRKEGVMLYVMDDEVLGRHALELGNLVAGYRCIAMRASETLTLRQVKSIAGAMLREVAEKRGRGGRARA